MTCPAALSPALVEFCQRHGRDIASLQPAGSDASVRRYFRIQGPAVVEILMDASAAPHSIAPFVKIAGILRRAGLAAPEIFHYDESQGFMLLQDLGPETLIAASDGGADPFALYDLAVDGLIRLRRIRPSEDTQSLPRFDAARFLAQAELLPEMLPRMGFQGTVDRQGFRQAIGGALEQGLAVPQGLLLRDYHGQNIIWRRQETGLRRLGLLDFQDAGWGPVTYDLISLVEDARRDLPVELYGRARQRYLRAFPRMDSVAFDASLHVMAALRHLRILAVFARLALAGKPAYLAHMSRVRGQLEGHLGAPCLQDLRLWLQRHPLPIAVVPNAD